MRLTVSPEKEQTFALRCRILGWTQDRPVPTSLYHYVGKGKGYAVQVNGKDADFRVEDGYTVIQREWKKGDTVGLDSPWRCGGAGLRRSGGRPREGGHRTGDP